MFISPAMWWLDSQSEFFGLLCPKLTDPLKGRETAEALQTLGEVVGIEERRDVPAEPLVVSY
jgi:hypothetical protein